MFKSIDLPYVIQFAVMFHTDKPVDWLLDPIIETRFCPHDTVWFDFFYLLHTRKKTVNQFRTNASIYLLFIRSILNIVKDHDLTRSLFIFYFKGKM